MSSYDPDAILADPNAHPVHKRYADISLLEWFFRPGLTHAEAAAAAVCSEGCGAETDDYMRSL